MRDKFARRNKKGEGNVKLKGLVLGLVALALIIPMVQPASACYEYTPGYWKHNVTVYIENRDPRTYAADADGVKESNALMVTYAAWIAAHKDNSFTLQSAYNAFWARGPGVQITRQQLADWFNEAKYYT